MTNFEEKINNLNLSYGELMKEKSGYYDKNQYHDISLTKDQKAKIIEMCKDIIKNKPDDFDGYYDRYYNFTRGVGEQYLEDALYDGTDDHMFYNLDDNICRQLCEIIGVKFNKDNTHICVYTDDYDSYFNLVRIVTNPRHPEWKLFNVCNLGFSYKK